MAVALLTFPQAASAQRPETEASPVQQSQADSEREPEDDRTLEKAGRIASQPVRDVGISKDPIPDVLQEAVASPYAPPPRYTCPWLDYELARLNQVLGPDFGESPKQNEDRAEKIALAGGEMIVNSLIPFRGLVREISGAAPADRRKTAAINAGLARRGYLRGLVAVYRCATPRASAIAAK